MAAWLLAVSPLLDGVETTWRTDAGILRAVYPFERSFYVVPHEPATTPQLESHLDISRVETVHRFVSIHDSNPSPVLRVYTPPTAFQDVLFAVRDVIRGAIFTTDLSLMQEFCLETGLFPLCQAAITVTNGTLSEWTLLDSAEAVAYDLPPLRQLDLKVTFSDLNLAKGSVQSVQLTDQDDTWTLETPSEPDLIQETVETLTTLDPDMILTQGGDAALFHFAQRAKRCGLGHLSLSRNGYPLSRIRAHLSSMSYMTYGRVYHSYGAFYLYGGRFHFDLQNTFLWHDGGLEGVADIARLSNMDVQKAARGTIGTALTAMQIKHAYQRGILIPARKADVERFRTAESLLQNDRGGFIYSPRVGIHADVIELDFQSMYPAIMVTHNISPETMNCPCCAAGLGNPVPGTQFHTCTQRQGLVPRALRPILKKRAWYKARKSVPKYDQRQKVLKWILVTSFGYQGYRNARFGRIEAHEAINAWARDGLLKLGQLAEEKGYAIIAGIVDSLWISHPEQRAREEEALTLCQAAHDATGLPVDLEGIYKWIVFLPRREEPDVGVLNRYYGVFRDGSLKVRGIELRRRDTCPLIKDAQQAMLEALASANTIQQYRQRLVKLWDVFRAYRNRLENGDVELQDLLITTILSKAPQDYRQNCHQAIAAQQLAKRGMRVEAGMKISYLITDARAKQPTRRVVPQQLLQSDKYDVEKYVGLLHKAAENLIPPQLQIHKGKSKSLDRFLKSRTSIAAMESIP
ncbi:MAG: DNA polymerase domain-containing protein [Candidatus Hodarchaeota archaeon]